MWAYALTAPKQFGRYDVPAPQASDLQDGQVLLRTLAGAICGSDLPTFLGYGSPRPRYSGEYAPNYPGFPMHEVVGEVVASRSSFVTAGSRVVGWASGTNALSEFIVTDGELVARIDDDLEPTTAILIQTLACVIFAVDRIGDVSGCSVAILGLGPIGVLFGHVLKSRGAAHVTGVDLVNRSDVASDFGIDEVIQTSSDQWAEQISDADRPDVIVEAIGHQHNTLGDAINAIAPNGRIYYFGIPESQPIALDLIKFLRKSLHLQAGTTQNRHEALETAGKHLQSHPFLSERYVTHVFDVADVQLAYEMASSPSPGRLKVALRMP